MLTRISLLLSLIVSCSVFAQDKPAPINIWPGAAPGEKGDIGEEKDTTPPGKDTIIRLGNVSVPTITVYKPAPDKDTGTAVVICPGGGYSILAWNLEGTEICEWLNSIGVTGVLLKYRVPARKGQDKFLAPLQDVQRAIGLTRENADKWKINPKRIGVLGFSAGGHLAANVSNNFKERAYPPVDDTDKVSCRPDFSCLIYPAYLATKEDLGKLTPEMNITSETPPAFLIMTEDDPIKFENVFAYAIACKKAKVPVEVHTYQVGGHGYGLRPTKNTVTTWPARCADWMKFNGWLEKQ